MPTNAELAKEIDALRSEVAAMRDSLQAFNALYESVKTRNEALAKENKALRDENKSVKDDCRLFSRRLADVEQYSRANNVEIKGIPKREKVRAASRACSSLARKLAAQLLPVI